MQSLCMHDSITGGLPAIILAYLLQIPTFGFLYVAGWIGYVGRLYLNAVRRQVTNLQCNSMQQ